MLLLTRALSGNYVNFGVFALYGDRALSDCLQAHTAPTAPLPARAAPPRAPPRAAPRPARRAPHRAASRLLL